MLYITVLILVAAVALVAYILAPKSCKTSDDSMESAIQELLTAKGTPEAIAEAAQCVNCAFQNFDAAKKNSSCGGEQLDVALTDLVRLHATILYHALVDMKIMVGATPVHAMGSGDPATFLHFAFSQLQMENNTLRLGLQIIQ